MKQSEKVRLTKGVHYLNKAWEFYIKRPKPKEYTKIGKKIFGEWYCKSYRDMEYTFEEFLIYLDWKNTDI